MTSSSHKFDPYQKWFGIPAHEQPPNHYRLLRIGLYESDREVIENAYEKEMADLKAEEHGEHSELVEKLSRETVEARACLLNAVKKKAYDDNLQTRSKAVDDARQQAEHQIQLNLIDKAVRTATVEQTAELNRLRALASQTLAREQQALRLVQHLRGELELHNLERQGRSSEPIPAITPTQTTTRNLPPKIPAIRPRASRSNHVTPISRPQSNQQSATPAQSSLDPSIHYDANLWMKIRTNRRWQVGAMCTVGAMLLSLAIVVSIGVSALGPSSTVAERKTQNSKKPKVTTPDRSALDPLSSEPMEFRQPTRTETPTPEINPIGKSESNGGVQFPVPPPPKIESPPQVEPPRKTSPSSPPTDTLLPKAARKLAIPLKADLQQATREIRTSFAREFSQAKTPVEKRMLARLLSEKAMGVQGEPISYFAILDEARGLAESCGDYKLVFQAIDALADSFEVEAVELKASSLNKIANQHQTSAQREEIVQAALDLMDAAAVEDRFDISDDLYNQIRKRILSLDVVQRKEVQQKRKKLDDLRDLWGAAQRAAVIIERNPEDAAANVAYGKYLCLAKGDWQRGLPMLAIGNDVELRAAAENDLANPNASASQKLLGDTWFELGARDETARSYWNRAHFWYTQSLAGASGVTATQVASRIKEMGVSGSKTDAVSTAVPKAKPSSFAGRDSVARAAQVQRLGGTAESEAAVARALKWLAEHQYPDGSWNFEHRLGKCQGRCSQAGSLTANNGSTAMGLLPFLGAGQTHLEGEYKAVVTKAVDFLVRNEKLAASGGSFHEGGGTMYSHGLAAIAIAEAYGLTHDERLKTPAQAALNFIAYAQDSVGGGWRYQPKQAGDTSVMGWQLAALKTGQLAELTVSPNTIRGAMHFLQAVQAEDGAFYGYTGPGRGKATTAIGLLARMFTGWKKENPALKTGVEWIGEQGPSISGNRASLYYNYYANQVMFHYGGELWDKWNTTLRDSLAAAQNRDQNSHEYGSWYFTGDHGGERGGRLYATSLATLCLEVYYRYPRIYAADGTE